MASDIVGILGKKRSGKDTLARVLVEDHGFTRISLADPLREAVLGLDPMVGLMDDGSPLRLSEIIDLFGWEGVKATPYAAEIRRTLQRFGTEAVRDVLGPGVWAAEMTRRADLVTGPVVVPDVRFPEEYAAIDDYNADGMLVRLTGRGDTTDTHPSETALDTYPVDIEIDNSGPLGLLVRAARTIAAQVDYPA